ncbi:MAG: hypothetical protein QFF03_18825, partial [Pseudomonadota bacterium]|nr:hypothetical protein [Pseudomonadota bacterium]
LSTCANEQITADAKGTMDSFVTRSTIMNASTFRSSIFVTAMIAASAAFASADIVKCVDQQGKVTLTDAQCGDGTQAAVVATVEAAAPATAEVLAENGVAIAPAAPAVRRAATQRIALVPAPVQHDNWSTPKAPAKMLSRDVETLKAARMSMRVMDEASASNRHQRVAGLN